MSHEDGSWNFFRAEPADMGRKLLAIDKGKVPSLKLLDELHKRHFGCIIDPGKHGLSKEGASDRHAVQSADQTTILPCFHGMGVAELVQMGIGVQHISGDPSASLWILRARSRALFHDMPKAGIERDGEEA